MTPKNILIGAAATTITGALIIGGLYVHSKLKDSYSTSENEQQADLIESGVGNILEPEPTGPGSGDTVEPEPTGPGSGDVEPRGPGSGDTIEPEPTGPGSGDTVEPEPTGPGSGDVEPRGPGSGDTVEPEPTGPGSGDTVEPEPTGPGSGEVKDENYYASIARGNCNSISSKSTCVEYIGSYWGENEGALACQGDGEYKSQTPCPRPTAGGCLFNENSPLGRIFWFYNYGGEPSAGKSGPYGPEACQGIGGRWILGASN